MQINRITKYFYNELWINMFLVLFNTPPPIMTNRSRRRSASIHIFSRSWYDRDGRRTVVTNCLNRELVYYKLCYGKITVAWLKQWSNQWLTINDIHVLTKQNNDASIHAWQWRAQKKYLEGSKAEFCSCLQQLSAFRFIIYWPLLSQVGSFSPNSPPI